MASAPLIQLPAVVSFLAASTILSALASDRPFTACSRCRKHTGTQAVRQAGSQHQRNLHNLQALLMISVQEWFLVRTSIPLKLHGAQQPL
jgi:hypothetical protein